MKPYTIAFKGLKKGLHEYHFEVDGSLFETFDNPDVKDAGCSVDIALDRGDAMMSLDITIDGSVVVPCDRCLEDYALPVYYEGQLLVKFSDEERESDGDVIWLMPVEDELDLTQYIYESIVLSLPYQRVHPDGECNPEMLERFRIVTGDEFDRIEAEAGVGSQNDGQWAKLEALKQQMEAGEQSEAAGAATDSQAHEGEE